jgi:hypothetical protein
MADNTQLSQGLGGDTMRDRDRAGVKTTIVGLDLGIGTGSEVLMAGAMPVTGTFWQATQPVSIASAVAVTGTFWQTTQPVSGTITANAGTNLNTSLLALEAGGNLATLVSRAPALGQALAAASVPVVLTAAQLTTLTPLTTVAVTGTFWQATQPISGTVTANAGTGTFTVTGAGGTFPVTGTFWQATQPVSGTFWQATQPVSLASNVTVIGTGTFAVQATQAGTWNIGSITTLPALPAGSNLLGSVAVGQQVGQVFNATTALSPQYSTFSTSAAGATQIVAAQGAGKKIYVLRWSVSSNGTTNVNLQSHTTTANATGIRYLTQFASGGGAYCPAGIMATAANEALDVNNSAAVAISGEVTWVAF